MKDKIKIGYIGLGRRSTYVLEKNISKMKDVEVKYICDSYEPALIAAKNLVPKETILTTDYNDILEDKEVDAVFIMTGWEGRSEIAIKSMNKGKYTAIEVGCAYDLKECFDLVETYEKTKSPLMMLENCCYGRRELMALNIVKKNLFGEIVHCDGGYKHYLPECELFKDLNDEHPHYRLGNYIKRNCEQYPTHELGPISKILNINNGNRMLTLCSMASKSCGLKNYAKSNFGEDSIYAKIDYKQGDIIETLIKCAGGETIHLCLDTTVPRPYYSRGFTVRGVNGGCFEEGNVVFFGGMEEEIKNNEEEMFEKYDHPIHKEYEKIEKPEGHGGMDWLVCRAFIESVKRGINTPIDAYDTASWMAIGPLSEISINKGGAPVEIPDFTKGKWMHRKNERIGKYSLDEIVDDPETKIIP